MAKNVKISTITDLRDDLQKVYESLRNNTMEVKEAVEINNTTGKIISSAKIQLAYHSLRKEKPEIPFIA